MPELENGDRFPNLQVQVLDQDDPLTLPDDLDADASVLVFYRGHV